MPLHSLGFLRGSIVIVLIFVFLYYSNGVPGYCSLCQKETLTTKREDLKALRDYVDTI